MPKRSAFDPLGEPEEGIDWLFIGFIDMDRNIKRLFPITNKSAD